MNLEQSILLVTNEAEINELQAELVKEQEVQRATNIAAFNAGDHEKPPADPIEGADAGNDVEDQVP